MIPALFPHSLRRVASLSGLFLLATAAIAFAQTEPVEPPPAEATEVIELDAFTVTATNDRGYFSANSTSATRTNELVKNTPISLTVINAQLMEDLLVLDDQDLARATASVTQDPDGFSFNQIRIRGFRSLTQRYDLFWREIERDGYNIERVDIVKGANSLIYGQADPGGKVNSIPKNALVGKDFANLVLTVGTQEFLRATADVNVSVNKQLAFRVMGLHFEQEFDQRYEYRQLRGATLETTFRPNPNTSLRVHLERIELEQNLQPGMFFDATANNRYAPSSLADETDAMLRSPLTAYRNEFIYSPDAVQYLPDALVADLALQGNANPTREQIAALYQPWAPADELYSAHGPDKRNDRSGNILTLDWTQRFGANVQLKVAYNREDDDRSALVREGYSGSRVIGPLGGEYINTHWEKSEGGTTADALKTLLLWEVHADNLPLIGSSKHNLLLGYDWDRLRKSPTTSVQIQPGTTLYDGNFFRQFILKEQLLLANGFAPDAPNVAYNGRDDLFQTIEEAESDVVTHGLWFAAQSEFFGGRLRTLVGLRYDEIEIDHSLNTYGIGVAPGFFTPVRRAAGFSESNVTQRISDNNVSYDQVSPSVGGLFWFTPQIGFFANYAQSIQSPTGVEVDPFGDVIPPVYGDGYEYGLRFDLFEGKLNGQISVFYIEKENDSIVNYDFRLGDIITFAEYGQQYPQYFNPNGTLINDVLPSKRVAGDVSRAEGVDVEFYYNPTRSLSFVFSYTYNNLDAIKINDAVNPRFGRVFGLAPHNAIVHLRYRFFDGPLKGFAMGLSQGYRSPSVMGSYYVDDDNAWYDVEFDEELTTDAFVRYESRATIGGRRARWALAYRVQNLFDNQDLINRNKSAFYRQSSRHTVEASLNF